MIDFLPQYHNNRNQRSPCLLVVDLSASQADPRAASRALERLEKGQHELVKAFQDDKEAQHKIEVSIIDAGGDAQDAAVALDWTDAEAFKPVKLVAGHASHLAQGMRLALQHVEQHKLTLRSYGITYTRPWIMLVSHGLLDEPLDLFENVARDCQQAERDKRCVIFPILVDGGNGETLQKLTSARVATMASSSFEEYFRWLSASLASTSRSAPGNAVRLPRVEWARFN